MTTISLSPEIPKLRETWATLYRTTLPRLAKIRDPAQSTWPVTLDHCFARIILDNTIGKSAGANGIDTQWDQIIKKPAVNNMSEAQLKAAIALGEQIKSGEVDLVQLDGRSLAARGKRKRGSTIDMDDDVATKKPKAQSSEKPSRTQGKKTHRSVEDSPKKQTRLSFQSSDPNQLLSPASSNEDSDPTSNNKSVASHKKEDAYPSREIMIATLKNIQTHKDLTPFRKRLYTALLSVPRGEHTTYAAMAKHLGSVPRAVGNGMRHNPFAPTVPCHRVLASDGTLGGFFGSWGVEGQYANDKIKLLEGENVKFNSQGKVKGPVWTGFWDLDGFENEYGRVM